MENKHIITLIALITDLFEMASYNRGIPFKSSQIRVRRCAAENGLFHPQV